jgi:KaiC/GvpD/RAD55 family RecA-like ATPase
MNLNFTYREYVFSGVTNRGLVSNTMPTLPVPPIECYQSVFLFGEDYKKYADENKSVGAYQGKIYCDWIPIDIDNEDLEIAKLHTLKVLEHLFKEYAVKPTQLKYFFSGSKGFHILFPSSLIALTPTENLHTQIKTFIERLVKNLGVSVDFKIYDKTRIFRIPNTQNIKSGMYKIPITFDALLASDIATIKAMAVIPHILPFETSWKQTINTKLLSLLNESTSASISQKVVQTDSMQTEPKKYTKLCIHKILAGVGQGNRDSTALRLAVHFRKQGMTKDVTYQTLLAWNKKNTPPLDDKDIEIKINSAFSGSYDFGCNDSVLQSFCSEDCVYKNKPKVEEKLNEVLDEPDTPTVDNIYSLRDVEKKYKDYVASVEKYRIKLGIKEIDDAIRGIARGESMMVMGRTSVGKSIFMLNLIKNIALNQKVPVLLFTLESPAEQIYERLAQMVLNMTGREVEEIYRQGSSPQELLDTLGEYVYIIDKGFITCTQISEYIELTEEKYKRKIGCVVIDYVGRISEYGGNQYDKITKIGFNLTNVAKETNTALIFLHHVSSKAVQEGEPVILSAALDSGRLVDAPDFVLGLWRNITNEETSILNIALLKSRKGNIAQTLLEFNTKNLNLTEVKKQEEQTDEKQHETGSDNTTDGRNDTPTVS